MECVDRQKLMFDTVCTLTDMQINVFHAAVSSRGPFACQVTSSASVLVGICICCVAGLN